MKKIKLQLLLVVCLTILIWPWLANAITLNVPIGNLTQVGTSNPLGEYFKAWYDFVIATIGIMCTVVIMWAGFRWLTSRGNNATISDCKEQISSALIGLLLAFMSYAMLQLINPNLVQIRIPKVENLPTDQQLQQELAEQYIGLYQQDFIDQELGGVTEAGQTGPITLDGWLWDTQVADSATITRYPEDPSRFTMTFDKPIRVEDADRLAEQYSREHDNDPDYLPHVSFSRTLGWVTAMDIRIVPRKFN